MKLNYENCDKIELSSTGNRFIKRNRDNAWYTIGKCEICDEPFFNLRDNSRFCSRNCQGVWRSKIQYNYNNANWKGGLVTLFCKECNSAFKIRKYQEKKASFVLKNAFLNG